MLNSILSLNRKFFIQTILSGITCLGILLAVENHQTIAQNIHWSKTEIISTTTEFKPAPQPLWLKGIITLSGLGLIGLEVWWFVFSKAKHRKQ